MDLKELGQSIKKLRKEESLSQTQICDDLQISRATLSSLENGKGVDIGIKKVMQIVDYLGHEIALKERRGFLTLEDLRNEFKT
jgi:transcriptional regulator with XRE-family HTH domain